MRTSEISADLTPGSLILNALLFEAYLKIGHWGISNGLNSGVRIVGTICTFRWLSKMGHSGITNDFNGRNSIRKRDMNFGAFLEIGHWEYTKSLSYGYSHRYNRVCISMQTLKSADRKSETAGITAQRKLNGANETVACRPGLRRSSVAKGRSILPAGPCFGH